jgi:hypothetical protein
MLLLSLLLCFHITYALCLFCSVLLWGYEIRGTTRPGTTMVAITTSGLSIRTTIAPPDPFAVLIQRKHLFALTTLMLTPIRA